jgi:hypothetical protein
VREVFLPASVGSQLGSDPAPVSTFFAEMPTGGIADKRTAIGARCAVITRMGRTVRYLVPEFTTP